MKIFRRKNSKARISGCPDYAHARASSDFRHIDSTRFPSGRHRRRIFVVYISSNAKYAQDKVACLFSRVTFSRLSSLLEEISSLCE